MYVTHLRLGCLSDLSCTRWIKDSSSSVCNLYLTYAINADVDPVPHAAVNTLQTQSTLYEAPSLYEVPSASRLPRLLWPFDLSHGAVRSKLFNNHLLQGPGVESNACSWSSENLVPQFENHLPQFSKRLLSWSVYAYSTKRVMDTVRVENFEE
jgi:hypothetical protein